MFADYREAVAFLATIDQLKSAMATLLERGFTVAAGAVDAALQCAEPGRARAWHEKNETEGAILYDLTACANGWYRREREQQMTVAGYLVDRRTRYVATVRDHDGEPIYWQDGFADPIQAWLWAFRLEDVPLPHNAAILLREAGIEETPLPSKATSDCPGCGNPTNGYGHTSHCPRFPKTTTAEAN